ncbi:MAG: hypothetical protein FWF57_01560 [Defluviitaleaceae bacterium]|nr:hypothetical protein [Defluviitaleaceae bacterium]
MYKKSLQNFIDYVGSEEELRFFIRNNADWNEISFMKMFKLATEVIYDYEIEEFYPKSIIVYFMVDIPSIIEMLSNFKFCDEKIGEKEYTKESYEEYISERINKLKNLKKDFIKSLY